MSSEVRCLVFLALAVAWSSSVLANDGTPTSVRLSNDRIEVAIDRVRGTLTVVDRVARRVWSPDPWDGSAGLLLVTTSGGQRWYDLSRGTTVDVQRTSDRVARVVYRGTRGAGSGSSWSVTTEISVPAEAGKIVVRLLSVNLPKGTTGQKLYYPLRPFALRTDVDRGAAVIPYWQGVVIPSYIFPMNGGQFCMWDDAQHAPGAVGELRYYDWNGLVMPWFGTHDDRSAAMAVVPYDGSIGLQWIANYNNYHEVARRQFRLTTYPRILALTPVWYLQQVTSETQLVYHVLPGGDHVAMAKCYRKIAKRNGLFVSLEEKARKNPDVRKLKGALYVGIYGGYPHYVNLPGMAFTFDQLDRMVQDMHDNLGLKRAFVHTWGTFSRYPPVMWPISEELGGAERLRQVVDRVKRYGWLYSAYHSFVSLLDHGPEVNLDLAPKDARGRPILRPRWKAVDENRWVELAKATLPKELAALGQNADITDIAFTGKVGEGGRKLAEFLASTGLVLGTERGNEWLVPLYHMFEGMVAPFHKQGLAWYSQPAPLFNLVYHDAVVVYGKIQDPTQLALHHTGDYYVKTLRAMLYGDGPMVFFSPYEYEGVRPYIEFAAEFLGPLHESVAFQELVSHRYLSPDFLVQRSRFAGGVEVTVNLGPTPFRGDGLEIPGYGFRIVRPDGQVVQGRFRHSAVLDGRRFDF